MGQTMAYLVAPIDQPQQFDISWAINGTNPNLA